MAEREICHRVSFTAKLAVTCLTINRDSVRYVESASNLIETVGLMLAPILYDQNGTCQVIGSHGGSNRMTMGLRQRACPWVPKVEDGRVGFNIGIEGRFLIKGLLPDALLKLEADNEAAKAHVKKAFLSMPEYARPPTAAFHYRLCDFVDADAARMFSQVELTEATFEHHAAELANFGSVTRHPSLREQQRWRA